MNKEVKKRSLCVSKIVTMIADELISITELGFPDDDDLATGMWKKELEWRNAGIEVRISC